MNTHKHWSLFVRVAVVAVLLTACESGGRFSESWIVKRGDSLPAFSLTGLDGKTYTETSILEKDKGTIIAIFATWCGPCQQELTQLQQDIGAGHSKYNIVAIGSGEPAELVKEFADRNGLTFPVLPDPDSGFMKALGGSALPSSILVNSEGTIVSQHVGYDAQLIKRWAEGMN